MTEKEQRGGGVAARKLEPDGRAGELTSVSPPEDSKMYGQQMLRMAQSLGIKVATSDHHSKDTILGWLYSDSPGFSDVRRPSGKHSRVIAKTGLNSSHMLLHGTFL